jgi:hypothetical protein
VVHLCEVDTHYELRALQALSTQLVLNLISAPESVSDGLERQIRRLPDLKEVIRS